MKTEGSIEVVEFAIEDMVRKLDSDNDARIERLSRELGTAQQKILQLQAENDRLHMENQALRDDLHVERQNRMLRDFETAGEA